MHWPAEDGTPIEEYWQTLLDLKKEGRARAVGLSNHNVDQLARAEAIGHVDTLQPPFSLIHRDFAAAELPWCRDHQTGVIVYSPMQSGLLTGAFTVERAAKLGPDDWRFRVRRIFRATGCAAILLSPTPCGQSPNGIEPRLQRSPWHGP